MKMPRISVIMITYNQQDLVHRSLDSLLSQKDFLYEICINDDCSTDGTWRVLEDYAARFPNLVKPVRNEQNLGIMLNTETVWKRPSGDLIYDIAGDDECPQDFFRQVLETIKRNGIDWKNELFCIYSDYKEIYPDGRSILNKNDMVLRHDASKLKLRLLISNQGACFSKRILDKYENICQDRSIVAESTQDCQLALFSEHNYYIPIVGCIYYAGIGISSQLDMSYHYNNSVEGYRIYTEFMARHHHPFDKKDLAFIEFRKSYLAGRYLNALGYYFLSIDPSLGIRGLGIRRILRSLTRRIRNRRG